MARRKKKEEPGPQSGYRGPYTINLVKGQKPKLGEVKIVGGTISVTDGSVHPCSGRIQFFGGPNNTMPFALGCNQVRDVVGPKGTIWSGTDQAL